MKEMEIVERLRNMQSKEYTRDWSAWVQTQCAQAADEIELLRVSRAALVKIHAMMECIAEVSPQSEEDETLTVRYVRDLCTAYNRLTARDGRAC